MLFRHGDVLIKKIEEKELPEKLEKVEGTTVAEGEATGHRHRFADEVNVHLFRALDGILYARVMADTRIVHEEHNALDIPKGVYRIWQQREYSPERIRRVYD